MIGQYGTSSIGSVIPNFVDVSSPKEIQRRFFESAKTIMLGHRIARGDHRWEITALELYLSTASDVWRDETTHQTEEQLSSGNWYVHHYRNGNWHPPNWSGIDITAGWKGNYAGLLVGQICGKGGSATAFKSVVRSDFMPWIANDTWNAKEREIIKSINGAHIFSPVDTDQLTLVAGAQKEIPLWVGHRKGLKGKRYEKALLRISTEMKGGMISLNKALEIDICGP